MEARIAMKNKLKQKNAQSAMEYLMTYGWAILIIAVALVILFHMGVFNTNTGPRAQPGSCKVFRPYGPGTTSFINLKGICNGELPQYVAQFNVQNSYIQPARGVLGGVSSFTVSLWFNTKTLASGGAQYGWIDEEGVWGFKFGQPTSVALCFATTAGSWAWCAQAPSSYVFSTNRWYFIAVTYNSGNPV
ncbi:MAG: LamG-like jellyroll fold domain-containing protein, partial [Candidatus Micrarchaeia archaeon]